MYEWSRHRPLPRKRTPHRLPAHLIVSLTSHAPRFKTLAATLRGLLAQSIMPDKLILWVAHEEIAKLPHAVRSLQKHGLTLCGTDDLGPYTKIIPAINRYPQAFIVTADDDTYYGPSWLDGLVAGYRGDPTEIICRRAHKIQLDKNGEPLSYREWIYETDYHERSPLILPTGVGGVLYPPGSLHSDTSRKEVFSELAPTADDLWLYWMARLNNCSSRRIGKCRSPINWPRSQQHALWKKNRMSDRGNDHQIRQLLSKYGFPAP